MAKIIRENYPGKLSEFVQKSVREMIKNGRLKPGDYLASERELGKQFSVSRITVRKGLDTLVEDRLLEKISSKGYKVRSLSDTAPVSRKNGSAVVFVHSRLDDKYLASDPEHADVWKGAREESARLGRLVMINPLEDSFTVFKPEQARDLANIAAGVIWDHTDRQSIENIRATGVPLVLIHYIHYEADVDTIVQDDVGGIVKAVQYLTLKGCTRPGFINAIPLFIHNNKTSNAERRLSGFQMGCRKFGISERDTVIEPIPSEDIGNAVIAARKLIDKKIDSLVISHRGVMNGVLEACREKGLEPGKDLPLVVWQKYEEYGFPYITWDQQEMGRYAVRRINERILNPGLAPIRIEIPTRLVVPGKG